MMADFRALCAELLWALENAISIIYREDGTKHIGTAEPIVNRARAALADEPAVPQGREPAAVTGQPSDGEVAELTAWLRMQGEAQKPGPKSLLSTKTKKEMHANGSRLIRAAELLERQAPVAVRERPWEREGWCDTDGLCWLGSDALDGFTATWLYGSPAWAERFPNVHRVSLPTHALPLPEVDE